MLREKGCFKPSGSLRELDSVSVGLQCRSKGQFFISIDAVCTRALLITRPSI